MITLEMRFGSTGVPVLLGSGPVFERATSEAIRALAPDRVFVIVDPIVAGLYAEDVRRFAALGDSPGTVFIAPEGERCKTLPTLGEATETILAGGATKRSLVLVFGGGATMNVGGLAAALVYRGLPLCYVPTTLMAQNDVVPSMKTAINVGDRKNNFGTFHAASLNVVNTGYLRTLPTRELRAGMGELVKNALVLGGGHFTLAERMLDAHAQDTFDDSLLVEIVEAGIRAKLPLLAVDEREACAGMIFRYGHTVGSCAGAQLRAGRSAPRAGRLLGDAVVCVRGVRARADGWLGDRSPRRTHSASAAGRPAAAPACSHRRHAPRDE